MPNIRIGNITIPEHEVETTAIRAQGAGGQNVNKVATAIHLRFDVGKSSLSDMQKSRILASGDHHLTADGVIIIKAQAFRSQEKNRRAAEERLAKIIGAAMVIPKSRRATKPSKNARKKRVESKKKKAQTKKLRGKVDY